MAEIKTAVIALCNATTAIVTTFGHRITPDKIPDKQTYPHARVIEIGNDQLYHMTAESGRTALVQMDVFGEDVTVDADAELIRSTFSGFKGAMGSSGVTAGIIKARLVSGNYDALTRKHKRILELEISTND